MASMFGARSRSGGPADRPARALLHAGGCARRVAAILLAVVALLTALRIVHAVQPAARVTTISRPAVVVVGVQGRTQPDAVDQMVIRSRTADVQVGAVSVRPRYIGDCAAAGWATLGAGRRTSVGGRCEPRVERQQVADSGRLSQRRGCADGDAGVAGSPAGLAVSATMEPLAALAAADGPDGTLANSSTASGLPPARRHPARSPWSTPGTWPTRSSHCWRPGGMSP